MQPEFENNTIAISRLRVISLSLPVPPYQRPKVNN